jgi:hypothetical protein
MGSISSTQKERKLQNEFLEAGSGIVFEYSQIFLQKQMEQVDSKP